MVDLNLPRICGVWWYCRVVALDLLRAPLVNGFGLFIDLIRKLDSVRSGVT